MWGIPYICFLILVLCAVFVLGVMWVACRLRLRTIRVHFDERFAERTRIARELQDTMLQTLQGSKLVAEDALEKPNDPVHMRLALEKLSSWLEQATQEGQAALNSLRTSTTETNDHPSNRVTKSCRKIQSVSTAPR